MKCSCGEKAVYFRRYSGQKFCAGCFSKYFEGKVWETIRKYRMIKRGEKIGVAISGGKDSTVLAHVLNKLSRQLEITLHAILIDEGIEKYRESGIQSAQRTNSITL
jgi:tRNA(Ile)-lysidine synthase TilS/MesJ